MKKEKRITRRQAIGTVGAGLAVPFLEGSISTIFAQPTQGEVDYSLQQNITGLRISEANEEQAFEIWR